LGAAGYLVSLQGAAKIVESQALSKMVAFDDFFYFLAGNYPRPMPVDQLSFNTTFNLFAVRPALLWGSGVDSDTAARSYPTNKN
jgi:hypothetical protein